MHLLMQIARRTDLSNPEVCAPVLALLATARVMHTHVAHVLAALNITEDQLATLLVLHGHDPDRLGLNELVRTTGLDPVDVEDALDFLIQTDRAAPALAPDSVKAADDAAVSLESGTDDNPHYRLTPAGRSFITRTVQPFFKTLEHCALGLTSSERHTLSHACAQLCAELAATPRQPDFT
ncbi:hypothetical protein [Geminisphaera colitermitum]|uniref:hypothetical protein n=1 Tax=Geminisphaera colitermitum TaxID=1148786 RepID=UPI000158CF0C|nr:hypothetical protein [Geminisphaera colitermitum]